MTRRTGEQRLATLKRKAALSSTQMQGANAGASIVEMLEAELVRQCILYLRHKEWIRVGRGQPAEKLDQLRGEIIGLSKGVLFMRLPYKRGSEEERKKVVGRALRRAKQTEADMASRTTKTSRVREEDRGSAFADIEEMFKAKESSLEEMMNGTGAHEGHTLSQVGRCIYCSCGGRVGQGRLKKR